MSRVVAVAGKGGTGKTTLAALLVRAFLKRGIRPILAVDADPNTNLPEKLGVRAETTIGDLREDTLDASFRASSGVSKPERLELALQQAIAEGDGIDVLVMGRGEGPGCYCSVNNLLRQFLGKIRRNYERVVIDNEAGMEHLSRRTDGKVDTLLITSDTTPVGLRAAKQVYQLARKQRLAASACWLVLTRTSGPRSCDRGDARLSEEIRATDLRVAGEVPADASVAQFTLDDRPLLQLPDASPAVSATEEIVSRLGL